MNNEVLTYEVPSSEFLQTVKIHLSLQAYASNARFGFILKVEGLFFEYISNGNQKRKKIRNRGRNFYKSDKTEPKTLIFQKI